MAIMPEIKTADKRLYTTGEYVQYFRPAFEGDSFQDIYAKKRDSVIHQVDQLGGRNLRVLDLGGGMGRMTVPLAPRHQMVLADLSLAMLKLAGTQGNGFHRLNCDAEALCFSERAFDAVIAIDLVSHLPNPSDVLVELRRILKPNGFLFIDITNSNPLWVLGYPGYVKPWRQPSRWIRTLLGAGVLPEWQGRIHHHSKRRFGQMLHQSGFNVLEWVPFGPSWCPKWFLAVCTAQSIIKSSTKRSTW
jgi:ubiquinone/menaquinone biosynthesis C-methylase UbiE